MAEDFFELETNDYKITKGDTSNLKFEFFDSDGNSINITGFTAKFTIRHPFTGDIIQMVTGITTHSKEHDDTAPSGSGIYFTGDTKLSTVGLTILNNNQIIILLSHVDTSLLDELVYPFDLELSFNGDLTKITPVKGRLIVTAEQTPS